MSFARSTSRSSAQTRRTRSQATCCGFFATSLACVVNVAPCQQTDGPPTFFRILVDQNQFMVFVFICVTPMYAKKT